MAFVQTLVTVMFVLAQLDLVGPIVMLLLVTKTHVRTVEYVLI